MKTGNNTGKRCATGNPVRQMALLFIGTLGLFFLAATVPARADLNTAARLFDRQKYAEGIEHLEKLVLLGDVRAKDVLGRILYRGITVAANAGRGCNLLEDSAIAGIATAQFGLGQCYEQGKGRTKDLKRAISWYLKAGETGLARGYCTAGNFYRYGASGIPRDIARAVALCQQGAEAGNRDAEAALGTIYLTGENGTPDTAKALQWLQKAADQKQLDATFLLGIMYMQGKGVTKNVDKGREMLTLAARAGKREAYYMLGQYFINSYIGAGEPKPRADLQSAVFWFYMASAYDPDANRKKAAETVLQRLGLTEKGRGQARAAAQKWLDENDCNNPAQAGKIWDVCQFYNIEQIFP